MTTHANQENAQVRSALLTMKEAAQYIGMSKSWLRRNSAAIPYVHLGTRVKRWRIADLDAFIASKVRGSRQTGRKA